MTMDPEPTENPPEVLEGIDPSLHINNFVEVEVRNGVAANRDGTHDATAHSEEPQHKDTAPPATNGTPKIKKHRIVIVGLGMVAIAFMFVAPRPLPSARGEAPADYPM